MNAGATILYTTGELDLDGPTAFTGPVTSLGGRVVMYDDAILANNITLGAGGVTVENDTVGTATVSGALSGSGGLTSANGTIRLTGISNYTGATMVRAGRLLVDGSIASATTVLSGATLGGTGAIGGVVTVASGGILSPGSSAGKITVGSLTLISGSQTNIELGGTNRATPQFDYIVSGGAVSLGGTLAVSLINSFVPLIGNSFDILDWGPAGLSGTFASLQLPSLATPLGWDTSQLYKTGSLSVTATLRGDFNRDGHVTVADIPAMQAALADLNAYKSINGLSDANLISIGDVDGSGSVSNADVQALLTLLKTGGGSVAAVPEPASIALMALALPCFAFAIVRWRAS